MYLEITPEKCFKLPEGNYRARLDTVSRKFTPTKDGPGEQPRFLFEVYIPSIQNRIPMAGRTFAPDLSPRGELRKFLTNWLGREFFEVNSGKMLQLESLAGREADLMLVHFHNDGFENPLVFIEAAFPPGTLKLTERPMEKGGKD